MARVRKPATLPLGAALVQLALGLAAARLGRRLWCNEPLRCVVLVDACEMPMSLRPTLVQLRSRAVEHSSEERAAEERAPHVVTALDPPLRARGALVLPRQPSTYRARGRDQCHVERQLRARLLNQRGVDCQSCKLGSVGCLPLVTFLPLLGHGRDLKSCTWKHRGRERTLGLTMSMCGLTNGTRIQVPGARTPGGRGEEEVEEGRLT